ncbi:hypothetical protein HYW41_03970 [Candidatus Daviesbacteria bacterium]|nr:hypothetical protein [Candidatus Daviesbacteria bacterium]
MRLNNKLLYPSIIFFLSFSFYFIFAGRFKFVFPTTIYNYFNFLSEAFLHKSLSFVSRPPYLHDLITFNSRIYVYWGPAPVLVIIPFIIFFGREVSDALYTSFIASFNPLILYFLLQQLEKITLIKTSNFQKFILCIFFAFGTVHFYLSIFGTVWFTSQVISIFYLLLSLLSITRYSDSKNFITLLIATMLFGLAVNGRSALIFYTPLFLSLLIIPYLINKHFCQLAKHIILVMFIGIIFLTVNAFYNYLRFGSFFENGYRFHRFAAHLANDQKRYGFFNLSYVPKNFYYMFTNFPKLVDKFPFFLFDKEGNSVLFTSPLVLISIFIVKRKHWQNNKLKLINSSILIGMLLTIVLLLYFWGTGWVQFGYRYLLDIIPFLIILLAEVISEVPIILTIILLTISILINILGTFWFLNL